MVARGERRRIKGGPVLSATLPRRVIAQKRIYGPLRLIYPWLLDLSALKRFRRREMAIVLTAAQILARIDGDGIAHEGPRATVATVREPESAV